MINKLYAVCLLVSDFETSLMFYRDTLGLTVNSTDVGYADFKVGESLLAIFQKDEAVSMFPKGHMNAGGSAVYAYQVEDVATSCKELEKKGVVIFEGPKKTPWGQEVAYFKDPDGHIWELTS
jgi:catechol 2,3-dioxygenase-like lactoylglutathione lyase family enzyme